MRGVRKNTEKLFISVLALSVLLCACTGGNNVNVSGGNVNVGSENNNNAAGIAVSAGDENTKDESMVTGSDSIGGTGELSTEEVVESKPSCGAWVAYWDMDKAMENILSEGENIDTICHFAAYFDVDEKPFIPEATGEFRSAQQADSLLEDKTSYLTVVNDLVTDSGSSLKDTQLLYRLFSDDASMDAHIGDLMTLLNEGEYDGIEIDYEAIKSDMNLWQLFVKFERKLLDVAADKGYLVRVLLEPGCPTEDIDFPEGAEYVMMCYNLHGYDSDPGPKADKQFLLQLADKMRTLPGEKNFALANGGFDFGSDGSVKAYNDADVSAMAAQLAAEPVRDENSGALYFEYTDDEGTMHTVWYSDSRTIEGWKQVLTDAGYNRFTIWRF